jgi:hypothetical protein
MRVFDLTGVLLSPALVLLSTLFIVAACGDSSRESTVAPRQIGTDQFGCPTIEPTRWAPDEVDYEAFCGEGCSPQSATAVQTGSSCATTPLSEGMMFVACLDQSVETPELPPQAPGTQNLECLSCARNPVDGRDYVPPSRSSDAVRLMFAFCWLPCGVEQASDLPEAGIRELYASYCFGE